MVNLYRNQSYFYTDPSNMSYYYGFDVDADVDGQIEIYKSIRNAIISAKEVDSSLPSVTLDSIEWERSDFYAIYGGLFFLGITLGSIFILAAVLIMYYKQVSEGYEDQSRFDILQKVGMTHREIRSSINSQVLTVFFLPLLVAGIHTAASFKIVSAMLAVFGLTNTNLFALTSLACFALFSVLYVLVYLITSRSYYGIVNRK
jgi:putative ABC transport system permease protein